MKVKELITELEKLPPDIDVYCKFFYHFSKNINIIHLPKSNIVVFKKEKIVK